MSSTKSKAAAEAATATIEQSAAATTKGIDKTLVAMKEGMEKAAKGFETSQMKMKESVEKAMKTAEEMMSFSQGNLEAFMKASQIYASGFQDISKHIAASSKASRSGPTRALAVAVKSAWSFVRSPSTVRARELNPRLPVIYMSGYRPELMVHDCALQEGVNFFTKPFPIQKLAEAIRRTLDAAPGAGKPAGGAKPAT